MKNTVKTIPYPPKNLLQDTPNPYHLEINGIQVELRFTPNAPTLQEKVIELCSQNNQLCS